MQIIKSKIKFVSVDFQKDFSRPGGKFYRPPRSSVNFLNETLVPFLRRNKIKVAEIVSDYRQPRPGDSGDCCYPGEWGYESEIPEDVKAKPVWVKCMNSPIWVREHGGVANRKPGLPKQAPASFDRWLASTIGRPAKTDMVILLGLTLDCCVLCTAQELGWRGYNVYILKEATDVSRGGERNKKKILNSIPLTNWAESISWNELKEIFKTDRIPA